MFSDYLRRLFRPILTPLARALAAIGITPNGLTVIGLTLNVIVGAVLASGHLRIGGLLVLLASACDGLDGALARYTNTDGPFGAFLDSTLDRYSEASLFTGLLWHFSATGNHQAVVLTGVALFGSLAVSYTRARAEGLHIECKVGLLTRMERMFVLAIGLAIGQPLATLWVLAIFSHLTALQRILHVRRAAPSSSQS